jgi:hypothetical protein
MIAAPLSKVRRFCDLFSARFEQNSGEHRYLATLNPLYTECTQWPSILDCPNSAVFHQLWKKYRTRNGLWVSFVGFTLK